MKPVDKSLAVGCALLSALALACCDSASPGTSASTSQWSPLGGFQGRFALRPKLRIDTNAKSGWLVEPPGSSGFIKAGVTKPPNPDWAPAMKGSKWISANKTYGTGNGPDGYYTYEYTFCPAIASSTPSISLNVLADNAFDINLNGNDFDPTPFLNYGSDAPFTVPQTVSTSTGFSTTGNNVLQVIVENQTGPTGLDLSGHASDVKPSC